VSSLAGSPVERGSIDPGASDWFAGAEASHGGGARPVLGSADEVLLAAVAKQVQQPIDLRCGLFRDEDRLVAAPPELLAPADRAADLAGEVGVEVVHEGGEAGGARNSEEQVVVVAKEDEGVHLHRVEADGAGENASAQVGDQRCRLE
jgi:hypothetical protein